MAYPKGKPRPAGSGRAKGTPNKSTAELKDMILGALEAVGGEDYLQRQAEDNPSAFLQLVGKVLPKDLNIGGGLKLKVELIGVRRTDR